MEPTALLPNNHYTEREREFYNNNAPEMAQGDHRQHDANPDYHEFFMKPFGEGKEAGKYGLDIACGTGRNVDNLLKTGGFKKVDGVDISLNIIKKASELLRNKGYIEGQDFDLFVNNGVDLDVLPENTYDHAMSTIALQHIPVYKIRYGILKGAYRALKEGGTFTFQIGFGAGYGKSGYYENELNAQGFNSGHDVEVLKTDYVTADLEEIGFKEIQCFIRKAFDDGHPKWLFVTCKK